MTIRTETVILKTGKVFVDYVGHRNLGRCYNEYQYLVRSEGLLTDRDIQELKDGGSIGYGQETEVSHNDDGSILITRRVDSGD